MIIGYSRRKYLFNIFNTLAKQLKKNENDLRDIRFYNANIYSENGIKIGHNSLNMITKEIELYMVNEVSNKEDLMFSMNVNWKCICTYNNITILYNGDTKEFRRYDGTILTFIYEYNDNYKGFVKKLIDK